LALRSPVCFDYLPYGKYCPEGAAVTDPSALRPPYQPPALGRLLRDADPDRLVDVTAAYVAHRHVGCRIDVLLADYRISGLWPVLQDKHVSAGSLGDQTAAARAFASQRTVIEPATHDGPARALIPLSMWAERIGVMVVDLVDDPDTALLADFASVADELAVALLAADRSTDRYRRTRRRQRLTMAAEMQWELLPGRALGGRNFHLAGQLEPAYAVSGDHFDWSLNSSKLTITALNGDGNGISATLLTVVAVNAMRNARRSAANLVEQAELASDAVFSLHGGRRHVATLLLEIDLQTGVVLLIDAGSPSMLRLRGTQVAPIEVDHQLPLGMFADASYTLQQITLAAEDRVFIVSDGVHGAAPGSLPAYGDKALITAVRSTRLQPVTEAVGTVMHGLQDYHDGHDLADDAVIVCLEWLGAIKRDPDSAH
jgi:serine phosphatase RsbU (regulator of sigma subunit)